jgi:hypothetical protein
LSILLDEQLSFPLIGLLGEALIIVIQNLIDLLEVHFVHKKLLIEVSLVLGVNHSRGYILVLVHTQCVVLVGVILEEVIKFE